MTEGRFGRLGLILFVAVVGALSTRSVVAQSMLKDVGCAQENSLRSLEGATSTNIIFVNQSEITIRTYWLNYEGRRVFYAEVPPGKNYVQQTYVTHPWVITNNRSGDCVAIYEPLPFDSIVVIR